MTVAKEIDTGEATKTITINDFEEVKLTPFYTCKSDGVYYHSFPEIKGETIEKKERLSDMINLLGFGYDDGGDCYRVFEWKDRQTQKKKRGVIAYGDIGMSWRELQSKGIAIQSGRLKRDKLADYLMNDGAKTQYLITNQTGWIDNNRAYVMPSGKVLGNSDAKIIYNGDTSQAMHYSEKGTIDDWQQHIARYAKDNSRLMLVLGTSFAAPLMRLIDIEGGGFHLFGDSSDGKTTVAKVALSVWGKADDLKLTWTGTSHALENIANARNDNFLLLDEIGQGNHRAVKQTAYGLLNGVGKAQGHKDGGNRTMKQWRVLLLSTGETTLETFLKSGNLETYAGQANRLPSIPANANKGHGVYDTLHDMPNGAELSEHLGQASNNYHGVAGRLFVEHLLADTDGAIEYVQEIMSAFMASLPTLTGQSRRVANRFALVAGAMELANSYGITGLATGTASMAIKQCFNDWLAREGVGKFEDRKILEQVEAFIEQYGDTDRFLIWKDINPPRDHAGYREEVSNDFDNVTSVKYFVIPPVFTEEVCKGFDISKAKKVLEANGILKWGKNDVTHQKKIGKVNKRFYLLEIEASDDTE